MPSQYETPEQIASAISRGDKNAETALLEQYYQTVLYILRKRVQNEDHARDLCQETFRITIERLRKEPLAEPDKLAAFLHSIAINLCIADSRRSARRQTYTDSDFVELVADSGAEQSLLLQQERAGKAVRSLLTELDNDRDRKILYRYYIDEQDKERICDELQLSHRHFDKVISRARTRFRELIDTGGHVHLLESVQGGGEHA
ncbi:MAG: RNA polymerase sigma factor [Gammaproteobacteria bacterium]|nr:RNA polymerase sigma factor [Gammaproteobacteria bacterium]